MGLVHYDDGAYMGFWVVEVLRFIRISISSIGSIKELRLAEVNICDRRHGSKDGMYIVHEGEIFDHKYLIEVKAIGAKLISFGRNVGNEWYALPYSTMSRNQLIFWYLARYTMACIHFMPAYSTVHKPGAVIALQSYEYAGYYSIALLGGRSI